MVVSTYLCLAMGACSTAADIIHRGNQPSFLSFPIQHTSRTLPLQRRSGNASDLTLYNITANSYLIELSIGTPGQKVKLAIDTGSDETWVDPDCDDDSLVEDEFKECIANGFYNTTLSSTYEDLESGTHIEYGLGSATLDYATDDITVPGSCASKSHS